MGNEQADRARALQNGNDVVTLAGMTSEQLRFLQTCTEKYIWWKTAAESIERPDRIILAIMSIGDIEDVLALPARFPAKLLWSVLQSGDSGTLTPQAWSYWHYRLGWPVDRPPPPLTSPRRAA